MIDKNVKVLGQAWEIGAVVQLKSGGPAMTISTDPYEVAYAAAGATLFKQVQEAVWFVRGNREADTFAPACLQAYDAKIDTSESRFV